jgi:hypothetical protein
VIRAAAIASIVVAALAVAGCGGKGKATVKGITVAEARTCVRKLGGRIHAPNVPAFASEVPKASQGGGGAFAAPYKLKRSSGQYSFFVYRDPTAAQAGAARLRTLARKAAIVGQGQTVIVTGNFVVAVFERLSPAGAAAFRACVP